MVRSRSSGVRLFVALELPDDVRATLAGWLHRQRAVHAQVRPVPVEQLHVTLAFLGTRPAGELDRIADAVAAVGGAGSCFGLATGAPVWLPPRRPRALAIEIHDERGELAVLHDALAAALDDAIGWRPDRPLRPHVTVARRSAVGGGTPLPGLAPTPSIAFDAPALTVFRSTLLPEGARYATVERAPLR